MMRVLVDIEKGRDQARRAGAARAAEIEARSTDSGPRGSTRPPPSGLVQAPPHRAEDRAADRVEDRAEDRAAPTVAGRTAPAPRTEKRPLDGLARRTDGLARALALWRAHRRDGLIPRDVDLGPDALAAIGVPCRPVRVDGRPPFATFADERPATRDDRTPPLDAPWLARDLLACALTRVPVFQRLTRPAAARPGAATEQLILPLSVDGRRITRLLVCDQVAAGTDRRPPDATMTANAPFF